MLPKAASPPQVKLAKPSQPTERSEGGRLGKHLTEEAPNRGLRIGYFRACLPKAGKQALKWIIELEHTNILPI